MWTMFWRDQRIESMDEAVTDQLIDQLRSLATNTTFLEDPQLQDLRRWRLVQALAHREMLRAQLKLC